MDEHRAAVVRPASRKPRDAGHPQMWATRLGFADEEMKVFGHDDVSKHHKTVAAARSFEYLEE